MKTNLSPKKILKISPKTLELSGIEAVSSLVILFEKIFEKKDFLQTNSLIVADSKDIEKFKSFLHFKKPQIPWYDLPPFPKPKFPYSESIRFKRRKWQSWASFSENSPSLFLASPQALLKKTNSSLDFCIIKKEGHFNRSVLADYEEKAFVERAGEFSFRGFILDIFSSAYDKPLRVQLIGDQIQSIHLLDKEFKKRQEELEQALIPSVYEWSFKGEDRKKLCAYLKKQENVLNRTLPSELFKSFSRGQIYFGFENLLNCLNETCSLDFFPRTPQIWLFEPEKTKAHFLEEKSKLEGEHPFFTSENIFLDWNKIEEQKLGNQQGQESSSQDFKEQEEEQQKLNLQELEGQKQQEPYKSEKQKTKFSQYFLIKVRSVFPKSLSLESKSLASFSLKNFSSALFKKSQNLKEDLKKLPVSSIIFTGNKLEELKKLLLREKVLNSIDETFF